MESHGDSLRGHVSLSFTGGGGRVGGQGWRVKDAGERGEAWEPVLGRFYKEGSVVREMPCKCRLGDAGFSPALLCCLSPSATRASQPRGTGTLSCLLLGSQHQASVWAEAGETGQKGRVK